MSDAAPTRRSYSYPRGERLSWAAGASVSTALAGLAAYSLLRADVDLFERGQLLIFTAAFVALSLHTARVLRIMRRPVTLDRAGVQHGAELVPWVRVTRIDINPLLHTLSVHDDAGRCLLVIRPELEAFAAVREYIIEHMQPRACSPPCAVPLLTPFREGPLVLGLALVAVWFGPRQSGAPALLFLGICTLLLGLYAARRRSLALEADRLVLRQGWRAFPVPYREITAVQLRTEQQRGAAVHLVRLERGDRDPIDIGGFRGGHRSAFQAIGKAWLEGRER